MITPVIKEAGRPLVTPSDDPDTSYGPVRPADVKWVTVPANVRGLAGQRIEVLRTYTTCCVTPGCGVEDAIQYVLSPTLIPGHIDVVLQVRECRDHGVCWYATSPDTEGDGS